MNLPKDTRVVSYGNSVSPTAELLNNLVSEGAVVIQNATIFHDVTLDHSNVAIGSSQCQQTITTTPSSSTASDPVPPAAPYPAWQPTETPLSSVELPYAADAAWLPF